MSQNPELKTVYRPDIDGLRAIAVSSVMIYHLNGEWLPGGYVGVDIFFVISGFVVTSSLAFSKSDSFLGYISEFYARRLARILPALVIVLISSAVFATLFIPSSWLSALSESTALYAFFGLSNWIMQNNSDTYFAPRAEYNPYTHTWSLGVEEQFYVIAPLLVYLWVRAVRNNGDRGQRLSVCSLIGIAGISIAGCIFASKSYPTAAFYFIGCRLWELALGALLFLLTCSEPAFVAKKSLWQRMLTQGNAWIGLAINSVALFFAKASDFPWPWAMLPTIGTMLMIGSARTVPKHDAVRSTLALKSMVWIGKRSYSLYLWHWPVYVLLRWTIGLNTFSHYIIAVFVTFTLSTISYRWIELPLRHNSWMEKQAKWFRIAVFLLLPIIGCSVVTYLFKHKQQYSLSCVMRNQVDWYSVGIMPNSYTVNRNYKVEIQNSKFSNGQETRYVPKSSNSALPVTNKNIFVMGDSHASALSPLYEQISSELGISVSFFNAPCGGYVDLIKPMNAEFFPVKCIEFKRAVMDKVVAAANPGDIVLLPSLRMQRYGDQWASYNIKNMYEKMYNPKANKLRESALEDAKLWLQPFFDKQLKVVFVAPTPVFKAPTFRCSDWFNKNNPICTGQNQQPREELERLRGPIVENMQTLAQTMPNIHVWDPFPILCPEEICRTFKDNRPLFFDGDHVSAYGNYVLYPDFKKMIQSEHPKHDVDLDNQDKPQSTAKSRTFAD